jgi:hypothetical protein
MAKAKRPVSINGIEFDALISESLDLSTETPEYPVETGFAVTDTIILKPVLLDMVLYVTDTPVTWKGRHDNNHLANVLARLEALYFSKQLCEIVTTDKVYANMAIVQMTISKTTETGYSREIPIKFKEIRTTYSKTTTIPSSYGRGGQTGVDAGTANTTQSSTASASSSSSSTGGKSSSSALYGLAEAAGLMSSNKPKQDAKNALKNKQADRL